MHETINVHILKPTSDRPTDMPFQSEELSSTKWLYINTVNRSGSIASSPCSGFWPKSQPQTHFYAYWAWTLHTAVTFSIISVHCFLLFSHRKSSIIKPRSLLWACFTMQHMY